MLSIERITGSKLETRYCVVDIFDDGLCKSSECDYVRRANTCMSD